MLNKIGTVLFIVVCVIVGVAGFLYFSEIKERSESRDARLRDGCFFKIIHWLLSLLIVFMIVLDLFVGSALIGNIAEDVMKRMTN